MTMDMYQHLVRHVLYPLDRWRTGDYGEMRWLAEFERTQYLPTAELDAMQLWRLQTLLEHAYRNCPYYSARLDQAGVHPAEVRSLADLGALPVLEKQDIQEYRDEMVARTWPREDLVVNQTGGSSGTPLSFFVHRDRLHSRAAATLRHNRWAGWDLGDKVALLWGAPRDQPGDSWKVRWRNRLIDRRLFLDAGHLTEARLADFHGALTRFQPKVILAYAGAMALFARYVRTRGTPSYRPRSIVTSAEVLEPADRELIEDVFGCPVFNRYGCREVSVIASECEYHTGMHTMAEGLIVEIVNAQGESVGPGEVGSILVTDLHNQAMPLIRYRIGDLGAWASGPCPCGRALPRLDHVAGRVTDFLVGADGRLVSGVFLATYLVAHRPSLGQVQILQEQAGQVLYRIRPGRAFQADADLDYLHEQTRRYLGADVVVDWELVDELRPEASGKFLFSRSAAAVDYLSPRASTHAQPGSEGPPQVRQFPPH
jgi:phenylacetate-CoA ligase